MPHGLAESRNGHHRTRRQPLVVVGNGMVGQRFCERLVERDDERRWRLVVLGEEPRPAYDRVHLSDVFAGRSAEDLQLVPDPWYADHGLAVHLGERVVTVDRASREVVTSLGRRVAYDALVLATGSTPFVPPLRGIDRRGVFVYRTIDDLEAIRAWAGRAHRAAVLGGGLLGLEAAKAVRDLGLETHVIEFAPRLMPRQVDGAGGEVLKRAIEQLGVRVHVGVQTEEIVGNAGGDDGVRGIRLAGGSELPVDMVIVSAGIRPRDDLARACGLDVGERGGVVVDSGLATSDPGIYCIGESALYAGLVYGLVGPGYEMAAVLADRLCGGDAAFTGADLSTKLKLLGVDVASFGDAFADEALGAQADRIVFDDRARGVYQKLVLSADGRRLLGGILVGDAEAYPQLVLATREGRPVPERAHELLFGAGGSADAATAGRGIAGDAQICSCNNVTAGRIRQAIAEHELTTLGGVKACTKAGTGCGGCAPFVKQILEAELAVAGREVNGDLCEHFAYTRQELFQIVKLGRIESFEALRASHGSGGGCEVCRPAVASILASTWNDCIVNHATIQDTNDRYLANIQRGGTYSVIPRIPGGEITPEKLIVLGAVARRFDLYVKITGGQRIDLLGARVEQLPEIWDALLAAGFESGHAYGKAMRTVKSCIGSTWCRYGVQDSTALAIRLEERYRGIRAPHKLKSAVSGCIRECAEAQSKDFGVIATEQGWNLYVCGNGGSQPRHADLIASDVDEDTLVRLIDRFLMYYIHTANPLERTARWLERLDGGIEYLKRVIVDDALGLGAQLERDMAQLVVSYRCEWAEVVRDPAKRAAFRHFANADVPDPSLSFVRERGQKRPGDWADATPPRGAVIAGDGSWVRVASVTDVARDGGITVRVGEAQLAVFHLGEGAPAAQAAGEEAPIRGERSPAAKAAGAPVPRDAWYATQAMCPHRKDMVLGRGLLGTHGDVPKVACPMHKKTFSLETGEGLSDPAYCVQTFPVEVREGGVWVRVPPAATAGAHASETICGVAP